MSNRNFQNIFLIKDYGSKNLRIFVLFLCTNSLLAAPSASQNSCLKPVPFRRLCMHELYEQTECKKGAVSKKRSTKNAINYDWIPRYVAIIIYLAKILIITIKVQKFRPHSVASKITEELKKEKFIRKG